MAETCHFRGCPNVSYDNCTACQRPTCQRHGRRVGDRFVCRECTDRA